MKPALLALLCAVSPMAAPAVRAACSASAQDAPAPLDPVRLWPKGVPDMTGWPGLSTVPVKESAIEDGQLLFNVTEPTVQPFLPAPGCATGAAVIIAPGGGFRFLSIMSEGTDVARWLAARGIAAFVLRYRLVQMAVPERKRPASLITPDEILGQPGVADGIQALRVVRADAARYGIDPARIGAIGFSAGGHVVSMMALDMPAAERPAFVAPIYGGPFLQKPPILPPANLPDPPGTTTDPWRAPPPRPAPGALPPFFLAFAQDDRAAGIAVRRFYDQLFEAGYRPEVHYYVRGGHGFSMKPGTGSSAHYLEEFTWWMQAIGMTD